MAESRPIGRAGVLLVRDWPGPATVLGHPGLSTSIMLSTVDEPAKAVMRLQSKFPRRR